MDRKQRRSCDSVPVGLDLDHRLLKARPNFTKALRDFQAFLKATIDDIEDKNESLDRVKANAKTGRDVRAYLACQQFLLQKHLRRLHGFDEEVRARIGSTLALSDDDKNELDIMAAEQDDSVEPNVQSRADDEFLKLLADMGTMKRRCKHILDVTDRYCVLQRADDESKAVEFFDEMDSSCDSCQSIESAGSSASSSPTSSSVPRINGNIFATTVTSVGSHLAVIAKTYTRRHSSSSNISASPGSL